MAYQCLTKSNLHLGMEHTEEPTHQEGHKNDGINEEWQYHADVLEDSNEDEAFSIVVRRILTTPKTEKED